MNKSNFEELMPAILENLTPETKAEWGIMSPQHMIEHLIITWKISRGRINTPLISKDGLEERRAFLMSDKPYEKNIGVPALQGKLAKLRFPDLESAKEALLQEVKAFHEYYAVKPDIEHENLFFGKLNKDQWHQLHFKHSRHHFSQFGLV